MTTTLAASLVTSLFSPIVASRLSVLSSQFSVLGLFAIGGLLVSREIENRKSENREVRTERRPIIEWEGSPFYKGPATLFLWT